MNSVVISSEGGMDVFDLDNVLIYRFVLGVFVSQQQPKIQT